MGKPIVLGIVLMLFSACVTVSPVRRATVVPTTTTTGTASAPASALRSTVVPITTTTGTAHAPAPAPRSTVVPIRTTTGTAHAPAPARNLTILRMEIGAGVMDRTPLDIGTMYPANQEKVYCYLEFKYVKTETTVYVVWMLGQNEMDKIPLAIKPYPRFRTWVSKKINGMKGEWRVYVLDDKGNLMKSATFTVQ